MKKRLVGLLEKLGLKPAAAFASNVAKVSAGVPAYLMKGATPPFAYQAMVELYCMTAGYSNDFLSGIIRSVRPRYQFPNRDGVLGRVDDSRMQQIMQDLNTRGFHVFGERLPPELCDRLLKVALTKSCRVRPMDSTPAPTERVRYDREHPLGTRYDFNETDLINDPDVQKLMSDLSILAVAQEYLGSVPALDIVHMWWHTAFSKSPDKAAAQYYHFDMDRLKWLKFFIYLTDVSTENGPHCFVAGSHRRGKVPRALLKQGYARLSDSEVREHFPGDDFIEFTGPRGTIIAEDTRGLHKGKHVERGDRLLFELEFTNSLFGGILPAEHLRQPPNEELAARAAEYPRVYRRYQRD
jgi:hypothetical protein